MKSKISEQISSETSDVDKEAVREYANNIISKSKMEEQQNYYLINDKIFSGGKMPLHIFSDNPLWHKSNMYLNSKDYIDWKKSLEECIVTKIELEKILNYLYYDKEMILDGSQIDITDMVYLDWVSGSYKSVGGGLWTTNEQRVFLKESKIKERNNSIYKEIEDAANKYVLDNPDSNFGNLSFDAIKQIKKAYINGIKSELSNKFHKNILK